MKTAYLLAAFAPLVGAVLAGFLGRRIGRAGAHTVTILGVAVSLAASVVTFLDVMAGNTFNGTLYTWAVIGDLRLEVGFLVDTLTATMMCVVTFVSLMVHVYTIGYMEDDDGYQRFFAYISRFTFSMMMLVMSNNFLQLFFGWDAVGLVSFLLVGFWYTRPTPPRCWPPWSSRWLKRFAGVAQRAFGGGGTGNAGRHDFAPTSVDHAEHERLLDQTG